MIRNDAKFEPAFTTDDKFFFDDPIYGISRRAWLQSLFAAPFVGACALQEGEEISADDADSDAALADSSDAVADVNGASTSETLGDTTNTTTKAWATGGTAAMADSQSYPDPFADTAAACVLTCTLTQGPCWAPSAPVRQDVSEGEPGLPMRLMFQVLDDACAPITDAEVEIWYCNLDGAYSGEDVENPGMCTGSNEHAAEAYYFRGRGLTDDSGKVTFDGCFPGWYSSRAVHIHFLVRVGDAMGAADTSEASVISQLFFPEDLTAAIYATVEGYTERGQPDTDLGSDTVLGGDDPGSYLVSYAQMTDGALLAWKTLKLSTTDQCGSMGAGGAAGSMGGQPPGAAGNG